MTERTNKDLVLATLLLLLFFAVQYWKPDCYWNSPRIKFMRNLIGDRALDILVYGIVGTNFLGLSIIVGRILLGINVNHINKQKISK